MRTPINITIWNEHIHEQKNAAVRSLYPDGIHGAIAAGLADHEDLNIRTATLEQADHGLPPEVLDTTDVLLWWAHVGHDKVNDEIAARVHRRVLDGMGLIVLHSGHRSKVFQSLLGTSGSLRWREAAEKERLWNIEPGHPITQGIGDYIELPNAEMYGERFDIPTPDKLLFISWFEGGEVFRSGCCWERGHGKIFYFRPGHETYPIFYNTEVLTVIANAVHWARPTVNLPDAGCPQQEPLETLQKTNATFGKAGVAQD